MDGKVKIDIAVIGIGNRLPQCHFGGIAEIFNAIRRKIWLHGIRNQIHDLLLRTAAVEGIIFLQGGTEINSGHNISPLFPSIYENT